MIVKTDGIVLSYVKYGETSIIAKIFTKDLGYGSFIVNSVRSKKSKKGIGLFQPFSILELVTYFKPNRDLQRISEFKSYYPIYEIHSNLNKSTIALFLTDFLTKALAQETEPNSLLYDFFLQKIIDLEKLDRNVSNFHIRFLYQLSPYLGLAIENYSAIYESINQVIPNEKASSNLLEYVLDNDDSEISRADRNELLDAMIAYYSHHLGISKLKSLSVLRQILG